MSKASEIDAIAIATANGFVLAGFNPWSGGIRTVSLATLRRLVRRGTLVEVSQDRFELNQPGASMPANPDATRDCGGRRPSSCSVVCFVKGEAQSVKDRLSIAPNVLDRYAVDLRKYGRPLDSGLPSLLNFVAEQLRLMNPPNNAITQPHD
jgi:hypothetical protein